MRLTRPTHRRLLSGLALPVALGALLAAPTTAATPTRTASPAAATCKVKNLGTGTVKKTLQGALDAAAAGATLEVRGTCHGNAKVDRAVTIVGKATATSGKPVLTADDSGRPLTIGLTVGPVTVRSLTIRDGFATGAYPLSVGGGILNEGRLTLVNVVVRDNVADTGGGIYNAGLLTLKGTTRITHNHADPNEDGGGIFLDALDLPSTLRMLDRSRIDHNTAEHGAGVLISLASMTMKGRASVDHNTGRFATGIAVQGALTMEGSSSVHDNQRSDPNVGGSAIEIWAAASDQVAPLTFTMKDTSRVRDNVAGTGGAGVTTYPDCGVVPVLSGLTKARVTGNTPVNRSVFVGC